MIKPEKEGEGGREIGGGGRWWLLEGRGGPRKAGVLLLAPTGSKEGQCLYFEFGFFFCPIHIKVGDTIGKMKLTIALPIAL